MPTIRDDAALPRPRHGTCPTSLGGDNTSTLRGVVRLTATGMARMAGQRKTRSTMWDGLRCAPGGIRTPNLLIRSQMLYPLSYGRSRR